MAHKLEPFSCAEQPFKRKLADAAQSSQAFSSLLPLWWFLFSFTLLSWWFWLLHYCLSSPSRGYRVASWLLVQQTWSFHTFQNNVTNFLQQLWKKTFLWLWYCLSYKVSGSFVKNSFYGTDGNSRFPSVPSVWLYCHKKTWGHNIRPLLNFWTTSGWNHFPQQGVWTLP